MDVILLKKVAGLGALGDKVAVRPGYGRNYLLPGGFAVAATAENLQAFEERRAELEREAAEALATAEARKAKLDGLRVTIGRKAGEEGRLFGSVGTSDIAEAVSATGTELQRSEVRLPDGPLRAVGEFSVNLRLHADLDCNVVIEVVAAD
ncbi:MULTISPECIES: 50S ribosomal protein L9 [Thiorhodovibrio]|uniref:50S ribosomal protein L9 n=1 Tax=Thiorhodovibrio TaxID=61593 RepID=UPI001912308B|nr:50S ribosomal protein L9 [Thiorhodovibrio litoralis]MBK5967978.1 50S ribosomal protein L9 [Thiorhodovibrio winogradskyi]WPL11793.1 50S ribosomal protein L9 [Thiorhodovibrio litoralis]